MVRWLRWHCPPDTGFEIRALAVWGRARYLSVTEAPHNTNFHTWMGKKQFCFFQTAETGNRTPDSGVKGSGANHYPRAPAHRCKGETGTSQHKSPHLARAFSRGLDAVTGTACALRDNYQIINYNVYFCPVELVQFWFAGTNQGKSIRVIQI